MFKKIVNFILILLILLIVIIGFINYPVIINSIKESSNIFLFNILPFLLFMMILNNILLNININYFFKNNLLYLFFMSILSGSPVNAGIIKDFLDKKIINEKSASLLICTTLFNNPIFLYNYFNKIFYNTFIIFKLFVFIYLINFIIFIFLTKNINISNINYNKVNIKNILNNSFKNTINSLLTIFITFSFFKLICDLVFLNNNIFTSILRGLIEVTQGLNSLITLDVSIKTKELLTLIILNFGSLSIHLQISLIFNNYNINYKYFYLTRIFLIIISFIMFLL